MKIPSRWSEEFVEFIVGDKLGEGEHRRVHIFKPDPTKVIKIDYSGNHFANISEWNVWSEAVEMGLGKWFAPIHGISENGHFLVMSRTEPCLKLPKRLPNFFSDIKRANFGRLNGRLVAHDYANHSVYARGLSGWEMEEVEAQDHVRS